MSADGPTFTRRLAERRDLVGVISGDRDLFQVVRIARGLAKAELIGPAELSKRYGLPEIGAGLERAVGEADLPNGVAADRAGQPGAGVHRQTGALLTLEPSGILADTARQRSTQHPLQRIVQLIQRLLRQPTADGVGQ